jgi:D-aminoacyl-tRNA deacylase
MKKPDDEKWDGTSEPYPQGQWQHSIKVCLASTKAAFPKGQIIAHLDRKSFKGWQRQSIKRLCEELDLPIGRTRDFE